MYTMLHFKLVQFLLYLNYISLSLTLRKKTDFLWENTCVALFWFSCKETFLKTYMKAVTMHKRG